MPKTRVLNEVRLKNKDNTISEYKVGTVNGYYNSANGKFYEEIGHITEIEGAPNLVYADLADNDLYIYKTSTGTFVRVSSQGNADAFKFGYRNTADGRFYETEEYIVEITADPTNLYIDLLTNQLYKYDVTAGAYQQLDICAYGDLEGKPTIEGVTLVGDLDAADLGLAKAADIPSVPTPSSTNPLMDGTAAAGTQIFYAREDHVHPSDTSKYGVTDSISGTINDTDYVPMSDTNDFKRRTPWTSVMNKIKGALGSAAQKDVPVSGNATTSQVVMGDDTRLKDSRKASDVYDWAKAENKPTYTASEVGTYTTTEIDNKLAAIESGLDWKEAVATYADISTAYPNPVDGWTVNVKDTDYTYRFNGTDWITISANAIPNATTTVNGLMTTTQVNKLENIEDEAQVNVQSDWDVTDSSSDAFIKNKPTIPAAQVNADWDASSGVAQILHKPTIPDAQIQSDWAQATTTAKDYIKNKPTLGTASEKDVPVSGNASTSQVVMGNDTRLSDDRKALDVYSWAKESTKPTYNGSEIKTSAAKTGTAQSNVTTTIAANTTIDNAVGTLLNNDVTVNTTVQNLTNQVERNAYGSSLNKLKMNTLNYGSNNITGGTAIRNVDNTVIVNITDSSHGLMIRSLGKFTLVAGKKYKILGGYNKDTCMITIRDLQGGTWSNNTVSKGVQSPVASGTVDEFIANSTEDILICVRVPASTLVSNAKLYPMIIDMDVDSVPSGNITDYYVPYYESNREIDDNINGLINNQNVNGVINILPNLFTNAEVSNVTLTNNTDGTLNISGTNDSTGIKYFNGSNFKVSDSGVYKMTGIPETIAVSSDFILDVYLYNVTDAVNVSPSARYIQDYIYSLSSSKTYRPVIAVYSGKTIPSGTIVKPMLSVASLNLSYSDYVPYAKSNRKLTEIVDPLKTQFDADHNVVKTISDTMNIYWTDNAYPSDFSNLTAQQVSDIVQALYDFFKKIGGAGGIRYSGLMTLYHKKASDGSQLGSTRDMVDIYANTSYSSMLSNNTNARFTMVRHPYGSTVQITYALWGNRFIYSSHGMNNGGEISDFDTIYTYNTISTYKG